MTAFSSRLRRWREMRGLSQLQLAERAAVSARHLSFLETGRAGPSRDMVGRLAHALGLSVVGCMDLLEAAGFAPVWPAETGSGQPPVLGGDVERSLALLLQHHEPYPALVFDASGQVHKANRGAVRLLELFASDVPAEPWSALGLMQSLKPHVEDWDGTVRHAASFFQGEAGPSPDGFPLTATELPPVFVLRLRRGELQAHLVSLATQLSVGRSAAELGLRIELFHPMDEMTGLLLRQAAAESC